MNKDGHIGVVSATNQPISKIALNNQIQSENSMSIMDKVQAGPSP